MEYDDLNDNVLEKKLQEMENEESNEEASVVTNKNGKNRANELVSFLLSMGIYLFVDQFNEPHVAIHGDGSEILKIDASDFNAWIFEKIFDGGDTTNNETVKTVQKILAIKARKGGQQHMLSVRTAQDSDGNIWYDMGQGAIKITRDGWEIINNPPILFKRFRHQQKQANPINSKDIEPLFNLINIKNEEDKILLKVFLVASFIPNFPHPVLILFGEHGTAKSTTARLLKNLIDPSALTTLPPVRDTREFIQIASHHLFTTLDNLSGLTDDLSDCICRVVTGQGLSKRKLFKDDDDFIYNFQHIVSANGINNIASKPDLLDRSVLIELETIPDNKRKNEEEINQCFEKIKPQILGACFNAVTQALRLKAMLSIPELPRMADFANWGYAIAEALGIGGETFISTYKGNIGKQNEEAINANPVGLAVVKLMEKDSGIFEGSPTDLFARLNDIAKDELKLDIVHLKEWPKNVRWVTRRLKEIKPNLEKENIVIVETKDKERRISIRDIIKCPDFQPLTEQELQDINDISFDKQEETYDTNNQI